MKAWRDRTQREGAEQMPRIPAVSVDGDVQLGRLVAAVDLDRLDPRIKADVVRELALGSSPSSAWRPKESRIHEVKPAGLFGWMWQAWGLNPVLPAVLTLVVWLGVLVRLGLWAGCVMAVVVLLLAVPWTRAQRRRVVDFRDAVVAEVAEADLGAGPQESLRRVTAAVRKLHETGSPMLTDEMWMLAYQVGADLAVASKMRTVGDPDTEEAVSRLERRAAEIATQFQALAHREVNRPRQLRDAAAAEQRRQVTRAELAGYIGPELPGSYTVDTGEVTDHFEILPIPSEQSPEPLAPARRSSALASIWKQLMRLAGQ